MNFKKFIKRMNRGIALGIVFTLAMTVFVIVDEQRFKKEEDTIKQLVADYAQDVAKLNIEVSSIMTPGQKATAEQAKQAKEKHSEFLSKYYTNGQLKNAYSYYKQDIESSYDSYIKSLTLPIITEQTFNIINNNISIKKYGAGGAYVSFAFDGKATVKGNLNIYFPGNRSFYSNDQVYYEYNSKTSMPDEKDENGMSFDKLYLARFNVNGTFYLTRTSDGWKIIMSNAGFYVHQSSEITAKTTDNNSLLLQQYIIPEFKKYILGGQEI